MNLNIDFKPQPWMNDGNCVNTDVEMTPDRLFVSGRRSHVPSPEALAAKKVCEGCPVATNCLTLALANNEREGIWGGLTPSERDTLAAVKARKERCTHDHEMTPENTQIDRRGIRRCRTCRRLSDRRRDQRKREEAA